MFWLLQKTKKMLNIKCIISKHESNNYVICSQTKYNFTCFYLFHICIKINDILIFIHCHWNFVVFANFSMFDLFTSNVTITLFFKIILRINLNAKNTLNQIIAKMRQQVNYISLLCLLTITIKIKFIVDVCYCYAMTMTMFFNDLFETITWIKKSFKSNNHKIHVDYIFNRVSFSILI